MHMIDIRRAVEKLSIFFPHYIVTEDTLDAYHKRLGAFDARALDAAVESIVMTQEKAPSFPQLLKTVRAWQKKYSAGSFWVLIDGYAPHSDEKAAFVRDMTRELSGLEKIETEHASALIDLWASGYKQLPGYKSKDEVRDLVFHAEFDSLYELGAIVGQYKIGQGAEGFRGAIDNLQ